jgi:EmrB/QacA subfamily drug resistance transporter
VFPPIALGVVMATLDASVVNIALPTLQRAFAARLSTVEWVALAYSLTLTGLLLSAGRLADARGRRSVYGAGLLLFTFASLLCGLAPTVSALIALRVLQGVGAALVAANGSALLVQSFPLEERGRALGAFGAMVGVGLALGPPLGGLVVANASWRWIFLVNIPLGLLACFLLGRRVPKDHAMPDARATDGVQPLLWAGALAGLMLALTRGPEHGWGESWVLALTGVGVLLLLAFLTLQQRAKRPLMPLHLVAGPLGWAVLLTFLGQLLSVSVGFSLPLLLEELGGMSAARSGAWLAVLPGAALFCAPLAGRAADRWGAHRLTVSGMLLTAVGLLWLSQLGPALHGWPLAGALALVGVGQGLFAVPNASALLSLVPAESLGLASGLQGTMRNLGIASGVAVAGALLTARYHAVAGLPLVLGAQGASDHTALAMAAGETYGLMAGVALLAAAIAWRVRAPGQRQTRR